MNPAAIATSAIAHIEHDVPPRPAAFPLLLALSDIRRCRF
jgi:hypothetical protein